MSTDQADALAGKADFNALYTEAEPGPLFQALTPLEYQVPEHAIPVAEAVLQRSGGDVLDLCCSYGINAALLTREIRLQQFGANAIDPSREGATVAELLARDRDFYEGFARRSPVRVLGLDSSATAIRYGRETGLLADGWAEDLETVEPSPGLVAGLADVRVILCTGGVGYIGAPTFERVLSALPDPRAVTVVAFVLRGVDYTPIVRVLERFGLSTTTVPPASVRQRRCADEHEAQAALAQVRSRGLDPTGREDSGWLHAVGYVSAAPE